MPKRAPNSIDGAERMNFSDQVQLTEIFLIANSVFAVALAEARNEKLKTGLSLAGLLISLAWLISVWNVAVTPVEVTVSSVLKSLPFLAIIGWIVSTRIHGKNWSKGFEPPSTCKCTA